MQRKKVIEVAYGLLTNGKKPLTFQEMWAEIVKINDIDPAHADDLIARFYTELTFDSRFVNLGDNTWELRSRVRSDQVTIELKDVYSDLDEEIEEEDEEKDVIFPSGELTEEEFNEQLKNAANPEFDGSEE